LGGGGVSSSTSVFVFLHGRGLPGVGQEGQRDLLDVGLDLETLSERTGYIDLDEWIDQSDSVDDCRGTHVLSVKRVHSGFEACPK
jgi:hypothetical protein